MKKLLFVILLCFALVGCNENSTKDTETSSESSDKVEKEEKAVDILDDLDSETDSEDAKEVTKSDKVVDPNRLPEKVGKYKDFNDMVTYAENIVIIEFISDNGIEDKNRNYEVKITKVIVGDASEEDTHTLSLNTDTIMGSREFKEGDSALLMYNETENNVLVPMDPDLSMFVIEKRKILFDKNTAKLFRAPMSATLPLNQVITKIRTGE